MHPRRDLGCQDAYDLDSNNTQTPAAVSLGFYSKMTEGCHQQMGMVIKLSSWMVANQNLGKVGVSASPYTMTWVNAYLQGGTQRGF